MVKQWKEMEEQWNKDAGTVGHLMANSGTEVVEPWNIQWWNSRTFDGRTVKRDSGTEEHLALERWNRDGGKVEHLMAEECNRDGGTVDHLMVEQWNRDGSTLEQWNTGTEMVGQ